MKSFLFIASILSFGLFFSCKPTGGVEVVDKNPKAKKTEELTAKDSFVVSKTACFGRCPVFECTLHGDGTATYRGKKFVDNIGSFAGTMPRDSVAAYISTLEAMKFSAMNDTYLSNVSDFPSMIIQYKGKTVKGHTRELPADFNNLLVRVDALIAVTKWESTVKE